MARSWRHLRMQLPSFETRWRLVDDVHTEQLSPGMQKEYKCMCVRAEVVRGHGWEVTNEMSVRNGGIQNTVPRAPTHWSFVTLRLPA